MIPLPDGVTRIATRVRDAGGQALLIGGAVRDRLVGGDPVDFDLEIYGLAPDAVRALAWEVGRPREVGKAFGVLEMKPSLRAKRSNLFGLGGLLRLPVRSPRAKAGRSAPRNDRDITLHMSLPRRESKVAPGHRGFAVNADPRMGPADAARRRDFTINAIALDPLTGEHLDPFHGRADLERRILRVVDAETFGDDPLRVLRGAVFAAQFGLTVDSASDRVIRAAVQGLRELPRERVGDEWRKLLLRPLRPSVGLRLLMEWGALAVLHPEFVELAVTPQNPRWHPEGDVWTHALMAIDEAASISLDSSLRGAAATKQSQRDMRGDEEIASRPWGARNDEWRWHLLLATLCHDLGKTTTTAKDIHGIIRSTGHDAAGVQPTKRFLHAIAADGRTTGVVVRLVREHLVPLRAFNLAARGTPLPDGGIRQLARRLHPATIFLLTLVADADHRGRGPVLFTSEVRNFLTSEVRGRSEVGAPLRARAEALGVLRGPPAPVLQGADLIALGLPPGPDFGAVLRRAEELRDERGLSREDILRLLRGAATADDALRALPGA